MFQSYIYAFFFTFIFITTSFILIALSDIVKHHGYDALASVVVIGFMIWLFSFLSSVVINIINQLSYNEKKNSYKQSIN